MDAPTVLVVDDEAAIADMLAACLADEGYAVRTVYDGAAALAEVERDPPDLVVSDVMMPGVGGDAVAMRLRERGIPVVLMSAVRRDVRLPGVECLPKPFDLDTFLAVVNRALTMRR